MTEIDERETHYEFVRDQAGRIVGEYRTFGDPPASHSTRESRRLTRVPAPTTQPPKKRT